MSWHPSHKFPLGGAGTCTSSTDTPWCLIDDSVDQLWYHTEDGRSEAKRPPEISRVEEIGVQKTTDPAIWSYFEWTDPVSGNTEREYIEPLVSHLRHPGAKCRMAHVMQRSFLLPPSKRAKDREAFLFDAGATSWSSRRLGGPSLSYFAEVWKRYGIAWDNIEAWECDTPEDLFYKTVPDEWKAKTVFHNQCISTTPAEGERARTCRSGQFLGVEN